MSQNTKTPKTWWQACTVRDEVKHGTLQEDEFAADLYNARMDQGPEVYRDANEFFNRTFPAAPLKRVVRDVLRRLAGVSDGVSVLRLQVPYGGGKTHSLIALLHLALNASAVKDNATVQEFLAFADVSPAPAARVALLPFDKFDVLHGLKVIAPDGTEKEFKTPWGALAYQLGGEAAFALVYEHEQQYLAPGEITLRQILQMSLDAGFAPLILVDEAVNYVSEAVNAGKPLGTLQNFFQALTQAVAVTDRACLVATLLDKENVSSDLSKRNALAALEAIFGRLEAARVPVGKDDVSELLRRRLFSDLPPPAEQAQIASAVLAARANSGKLRPEQKDDAAYKRILDAYPFHPDLLEIFYQKWTGVAKFQRTRGAIRLLALALRDAREKDPAPLIGLSAFLGDGDKLSPAAAAMAATASETQDIWTPILEGEIGRAREAQKKVQVLSQREVEQAVLGVFLHSQPQPNQKAETPDLYALLVHPGVDNAGLETGLDGWRERSWFLADEKSYWKLTTESNLNQMLYTEVQRLKKLDVDSQIEAEVRKVRDLWWRPDTGPDRDVQPHPLPADPSDVGDDTDLHYVVLRPDLSLEPAEIPDPIRAYFNTRTGPRTFRNSVVVLAPQRSLLEGLRNQVQRLMGWRAVAASDDGKKLSSLQKETLKRETEKIEGALRGAVRSAYSLVLDLDDAGSLRAQVVKSPSTLGITEDRPWARIRKMLTDEERLIADGLEPDYLLPGSHLELWGAQEKSKRAQDIFELFARPSNPNRPRFLSAQLFRDALIEGVRQGVMVLHQARPDGSDRYFWRKPPAPDKVTLEMNVIPAPDATLTFLEPELLVPGALPGLWPLATQPIQRRDVLKYFDGVTQPRLHDTALNEAIVRAVTDGLIAVRTTSRAYFKEAVPATLLTDSLELVPPPTPLVPADLLPDALPGPWDRSLTPPEASLAAIADAVATVRGEPIPWSLIVSALNDARDARKVTFTGSISDDPSSGRSVIVRLYEAGPPQPSTGRESSAGSGYNPRPSGSGGYQPTPPASGIATDEMMLSLFEVTQLGEIAGQLQEVVPALKVGFKVMVTIEGGDIDAEALATLNAVLSAAGLKLRFEA